MLGLFSAQEGVSGELARGHLGGMLDGADDDLDDAFHHPPQVRVLHGAVDAVRPPVAKQHAQPAMSEWHIFKCAASCPRTF
jgi:hypothetical protein